MRSSTSGLGTELRAVAASLDDEFRDHIDRVTRDMIALGTPPEDAYRRAEAQFGRLAGYRRRIVLADRMKVIRDHLGNTLRRTELAVLEAGEEIRAHPVSASSVAALFALFLGVLGALFALGEPLWRPLAGIEDAGEVKALQAEYTIGAASGERFLFNQEELEALRASGVLPDFSARSFRTASQRLSRVEAPSAEWEAVDASVTLVSPGYFRFAGREAVEGRYFDERSTDSEIVPVVLSHSFWIARFERDAGVVGKRVELDGVPAKVLGVASPALDRADLRGFDIARPLPARADGPGLDELMILVRDSGGSEEGIGRGVEILNGVDGIRHTRSLRLISYSPRLAYAISPTIVAILLGVAVLGLGLPAGMGLMREWARTSVADEPSDGVLSTSGRRVAAAVGVAVVGSVVGLALAQGLSEFLRSALFDDLVPASRLRTGASLGWAVFVGAIAGGIIAGTGGKVGGGRFMAGSLVAALATLVVVLVGTALTFQRNLSRLEQSFGVVDHDQVHVVKFWDSLDEVVKRRPGFRERIEAEIASMPGVQNVAWASAAPMGSVYISVVYGPDRAEPLVIEPGGPWGTYAEAAYLETMGLRLLDGRAYSDDPDSNEVLVNELLASHLAPQGDVVGNCLYFNYPSNPCALIVGIVENAPHRVLTPFTARYYRPLVPSHGRALLVRSDPAGSIRVPEIQDKMASIAPDLRDVEIESLSARVASELLLPRTASRLTWGLVAAAMLIWVWVAYSFREELPRRPGLLLLIVVVAVIAGTGSVVGVQQLLAPLQTARPDSALPAVLAVLIVCVVFLSLLRLTGRLLTSASTQTAR